MNNLTESAVNYILKGGFDAVRGSTSDRAVSLSILLDRIQKKHAIQGSVAEIGVHHGKFLIALASLLQDTEQGLALDVFEDQHLNLDASGHGDRAILERNIATYLQDPLKIKIIKSDSLGLDPSIILQDVGNVRLFSVDGCHTKQHTENDIYLSQSALAPGGVIIVDDVFNSEWPNVLTGVTAVLNSPGNTLRPFFAGENKLLLCEHQFVDLYTEELTQFLRELGEGDANLPQVKVGQYKIMRNTPPTPIELFRPRIFSRLLARQPGGDDLSLVEGFSAQEPWGGSWTDGKKAVLSFALPELPDNQKKYCLQILAHAYIPNAQPNNENGISISLNDHFLCEKRFLKSCRHTSIEVSGDMLKMNKNFLSLEIEHPTSPASEGVSDDGRQLGLALRGIRIYRID